MSARLRVILPAMAIAFSLFNSSAVHAQGHRALYSRDGIDVWAVGDGGIAYRSFDGGTSWSDRTLGDKTLRGVVARNFNVIVVGDSGKIWRSTDNGGNWSLTVSSGAPNLLGISMPSDAVGYVVGAAGTILKTTDGGANWVSQISGTIQGLNAVRFSDELHGWAVGEGGTVLHTTDGGNLWTPVTLGTSNSLRGLALRASTLWVVGLDATAYKSTNGGLSFSPVDLKLFPRADVMTVWLDSPDTVYIAGGGGFIRRSYNGGASWTFLRHSMQAQISDLFFVGSTGWAASNKHRTVMYTLDRGGFWRFPTGATISRSWNRTLLFNSYIRGNSFGQNGALKNTIYCALGNTVFRSRDEGETWNSFSDIPTDFGVKVNAFIVSPKDSNQMVAATSSGGRGFIIWTGNGGQTWNLGIERSFGEYGIPLEYDSDHPDTLYFGPEFNSLYRSTDFGHNWTALSTTRWSTLDAGVNDRVAALAIDGSGNVYAGGQFTIAGVISSNYVAKWNGASWSALSSGTNNAVQALAVGGGNLYAAGQFTTAGGVSANYVAKWDGTNWSALGSGMNAAVQALAVDGSGNLYAGGQFTTAGGASASYVAKWDGTNWSALGSGMNAAVQALAADGGGNIYAGGQFTTAGGASANYIAKWNGTSWSALSSGMDGAVQALAVNGGGNLYAGGQFTTAGGVSANYLSKWDGASWSALGSGTNGAVQALTVEGGGTIYAGGQFTSAGGVGANYVARWNGTSWSALGSGMNTTVQALSDWNGNLYAGGQFTSAGGVSGSRIAKWSNGNFRSPCDIVVVPDSSNVILVADGITGNGQGEIWKSMDGGQTFTRQTARPVGGSEVPGLACARLRNSTAFSTNWGSGGVQRTSDYGDNWPNIQATGSAWGVDICRDDPNCMIYGVYSGGLSYLTFSADSLAGDSHEPPFTTTVLPNSNYAFYARDRGLILALQSDGIYKMSVAYDYVTNDAQALSVVSPNGGEVWLPGSVHTISWSQSNIGLARVEYRRHPGEPWQFVADVEGYYNSYPWSVPYDATSDAKIRVRDGWDSAPDDSSDATFTIALPLIAETPTPLDFETWPTGKSRLLPVTLHNTGTSGLSITSMSLANPAYTPGRTSLTLLPGASDTVGVTFLANTAGVYSDTLVIVSNAYNNGTLRVPISGQATDLPLVVLDSPNGGEVWQYGTHHEIRWASGHVTEVALEYRTSPASSWNLIADHVPAEPGSYDWVVPNQSSTQARLRVRDVASAAKDFSSNDFSLTVPALGIAPTSVDFGMAGVGHTATQVLNLNNPGTASLTISSISSDNSLFWTGRSSVVIPAGGSDTLGVSYHPTAVGPDSALITMAADDPLSPHATRLKAQAVFIHVIDLGGPNGGESWQYGTLHSITWSSEYVGQVTIEYQTENSGVWKLIAQHLNATKGSYSWTIPYDPSSQARVRVREEGGAVEDSSANVFSITAPLYAADRDSVHFLLTMAGTPVTDVLHLQNPGTAPLTLSSVIINNGRFYSGRTSLVIPAGGNDTLSVSFNPAAPGRDSALVTLNTDDPAAPHHVKLVGDATTSAAIGDGPPSDAERPHAFALWQNQPNPFSGNTLIRYALPVRVHVVLDVFNLQGRRVATLVNGEVEAGSYSVPFGSNALAWNGRAVGPVPAGVYFYHFKAGSFARTRKMLVMK